MKYLHLTLAIVAAVAASASAGATSFTNGGFESTTHGAGELGYNTQATAWQSSGYNFLYAAGTADTAAAAVGSYGVNPLWGPANGSANGLTASSPNGGNFVAADGDFGTAPISQVITGLTVGQSYTVGFDYAFAQQQGFYGVTNQSWSVTLGDSAAQSTATYTVPSRGFSGWMQQHFVFKADATTEALSFLAHADQSSPPFALLDGVSFSQAGGVPEPAAWALILVGFGGLGAMARRRRSAAAAA